MYKRHQWKQSSALQLYLSNLLEYTGVTCMVLVYCKENIFSCTFQLTLRISQIFCLFDWLIEWTYYSGYSDPCFTCFKCSVF